MRFFRSLALRGRFCAQDPSFLRYCRGYGMLYKPRLINPGSARAILGCPDFGLSGREYLGIIALIFYFSVSILNSKLNSSR